MDFTPELENNIKTVILKNAANYNGKANLDSVISKIMGSEPYLRDSIKDLIPYIKKFVEDINSLTKDKQLELLEKLCPGYKNQKKSPEKKEFNLPPLNNAVVGKVVTRFPPEPNGYPHIGHAKAAMIDEEYARRYDGKMILRFDDTNPLTEKIEYYDAILEGIRWLKIEPDIIKNTSDDINMLFKFGKKLIRKNGAYVCTCKKITIHDLRSKGIPCECRKGSSSILENAEKIFDGYYRQNEAIVRFMGDMQSKNTAMRDPTLFRIIEAKHPKLGDKITLWPTYDFAAPIEDSMDGVTHALRTKEYELRNELYRAILKILNLRLPEVIEFSRLEFEGLPVSKRKIKPLIEKGFITDWDDPRLPTLMGLKKRGFTPDAIRKFVLSLGLTLSETKPSIEILESFNRKIIDPECLRLSFVQDPFKIIVKNALPEEIELKNHPSRELGTREVNVKNILYISSRDASQLKEGTEIRLIELHNIKINGINFTEKECLAEYVTDTTYDKIPKFQWVSDEDKVYYEIIKPNNLFIGEEFNSKSLEILKGYAESFVSRLKANTRIQFIRLGFCKIEDNSTAIFTHK